MLKTSVTVGAFLAGSIIFPGMMTGCQPILPASDKPVWFWGKESMPIRSGRVVLVGGCFDVFHYGHLTFLERARALGDYLIVALESDERIQRDKKRQPIHTLQERADLLKNLSFVDEVILLPMFKEDKDYDTLVERIHPDIIAVTQGDPYMKNKRRQAEKVQAQLIEATELYRGLSSTSIMTSQ